MNLARLRRTWQVSKAATQMLDLQSAEHRDEILRLLNASKVPELSIHFEILGSEPQILHLRRTEDDPSDQPQSMQQQLTAPVDPPSAQTSAARTRDARLFAIGSYTKVLINLAFLRAIEEERFKGLGLSWQRSACDLFNQLREAAKKSTIVRLYGNPTVRQLLLHENGFAPMNRLLIAPDGNFVMTAEEFLIDGSLATDDRYKNEYPHRGWVEYSNGNHIFAGMILEELTGLRLSQALDMLVLQRLGLQSTILDQDSFREYAARSPTMAPTMSGVLISSKGDLTTLESPRYIADSLELAAFGAWSSLEDLAIINRELLKGAERVETGKFTYGEVEDFLSPGPTFAGETTSTLCGCRSYIDSEHLGLESPNRILCPEDFKFYRLGKLKRYRRHIRHSLRATAYHKAGQIDGFSSKVVLIPNHRIFIVVCSNGTGPIDVVHHTACYILQEAFSLRPKQRVVDLALKEGSVCAGFLHSLEINDACSAGIIKDVEPLVGTYRHARFGQMITIYADGTARIHGREKSSSAVKIVYRSPGLLRLLPGTRAYGIDRWSHWNDLDFNVEMVDGVRNIVSSLDRHRYRLMSS